MRVGGLQIAVLVGVAAAGFMYRNTGEREAPVIFFELTRPGISELEIDGGAVAVLRPGSGARAAEIAAELRDRGIGDARAAGELIELSLPRADREDAQQVARTLVAGGEVSFHWVVSNHPAIQKLAIGERPAEVTAESDVWPTAETDGSDVYLHGPRDALERLVAGVDVGPDNRVVLEELAPMDRGWRTYVIARAPILDHRAIRSARVGYNPTTNWPEVLVDFTEAGAEVFASETGANIGRKLAIVHAGVVTSAPIVQAAIDGGRCSITPGRSLAAAQTLAALLDSGAASWPLKLVNVREVAPAPLGSASWARPLFAAAVGLALVALIWLIARFMPRRDRAAGAAGRVPWGRALVTAGGLAVVHLARRVPLPGLDQDAAVFGETAETGLSIVGLGLAPVIAAYIAVELVALAVPKFRGARHLPEGRRRLTVAVGALAVLLAVAEALLLYRFVANSRWVFAEVQLGSAPIVVSTLAAGVMFLVAVAAVISRHGLGNGYAVLIAGAVVPELLSAYERIAPRVAEVASSPEPGEIAAYALVMVAAVAATMWIFGRRRGSVPGPTAGPTAGIVPLPHPHAIAALVTAFSVFGAGRRAFDLHDLSLAPARAPLVYLGVVAALAVGLSLAFIGGAAGGRSARALPSAGERVHRRRHLWQAIASSAVFCLIIAALELISGRVATSLHAGGPVIAVVATAVALDVAGEWQLRRRYGAVAGVAQLHHLGDVELAIAELERLEIPALARSRHFRALYHVFAPFAPVEVLVPAADATRARAALDALLCEPPR